MAQAHNSYNYVFEVIPVDYLTVFAEEKCMACHLYSWWLGVGLTEDSCHELGAWFGGGVLTMDGAEWQVQLAGVAVERRHLVTGHHAVKPAQVVRVDHTPKIHTQWEFS